MKICDVCRAANEPEAEFCGTCGSRLPAAPPPAEAPTSGPSGGAEGVAPDAAPASTEVVPTPADDDAVTPGSRSHAGKAPAPVDPAPAVDPGAAKPPPTPWNTAKPAAAPVEICPVCQTENEVGREFCKKCANPLRPVEVVKPRLITRGFVARFLLSFVIGVAVPVGGAAAVTAVVNQPKELPATPVSLTLQGGEPLEFEITPTAEGQSAPITALPPTSTVQLASYKEAVDATPPGQNIDAKWWNDGIPRVPAVSQFDGGPLQKVNCVMASGAMLARLAFGIVTTGSQLRSLQDDQDGGTNFDNLNDALQRGWAVKFLHGSLTPLQLRALSFAGAGVVVILDYGKIPVGVRLQESFTGGHAVYIDAFTPNGPDGGPAYWVMDPIGHSWAGYRGGWWPAEDVELAGLSRGGGSIDAAWAFAGGQIPDPRPKLPTEAYPGASGEPTVPPIGPPIEDPMPILPPPVHSDPDTGTPPPETPIWPPIEWDQKVFELDPGTSFAKCAILPAPSYCPTGIIGIVDILGTPIQTSRPLSDSIKYLYADALAPGTYQVIFETPPDTDGSLFLWTGTTGELREASVEQGTVDGKTVQIATIQLDPNIGFSFFTTATGDGYRAVSDVGSMTVKQ